MATIKDIQTQVENIRQLGIKRLRQKGVVVSPNATAYGVVDAISRVRICEHDIVCDATDIKIYPNANMTFATKQDLSQSITLSTSINIKE